MTRSSFLLTLALLTAPVPVLAQSADARAACEPDVWRLCLGSIPNVEAIKSCLRSQRHALSPACRMVMDGGARNPRRRSADAR